MKKRSVRVATSQSSGLPSIVALGLALSVFSGCAGAGRSPSSRDPRISSRVEAILDLELQIQDRLEALNVEYVQSLSSVGEARERAKYLGAFAKTEAEKKERHNLERNLEGLEERLKRIESLRAELDQELSGSPSFATEGRLRALEVGAHFPLFIGDSRKPRAKSPSLELQALGQGLNEACFYEDHARVGDGLDYFATVRIPSISCVHTPAEMKLVHDPTEALSLKLELLTGAPLTRELIEKADPNHALDFSRAPELETIILSYLEYKHDFSGKMMNQALKYHADSSPNVKIQYYRYTWEGADITSPLKVIQRSFHSKILAVLAKDPAQSGVISGGRNIKDTFYMRKRPDYSRWPGMIQYGAPGVPFGYFQDLELFARGDEITRQVAAQQMAFWNRDLSGPRMPAISHHIPTRANLESLRGKDAVRHILSAPFIDDAGMEQLFVGMLDSAKKRVRILAPYIRPTRKLAGAMRNASLRGVQVEIISGIDFRNDNTLGFTADMNRLTFNELRSMNKKDLNRVREDERAVAQMKLYFWDESPPSIMHAKAILVDDDLLYVGSANMDIRTFRQDIENGFLVTGRIATEFRDLYDGSFVRNSKPATEREKTRLLNRVIIRILDKLGVS
jgi:phosphatidylserine/phosphatidylglycerophosphate/cardiolipin synthase-like enzyme